MFINTKPKEKFIETKVKYNKKFDFKITEQDKTLPTMYWLPKMHKTSTGSRFIVPSKPAILSFCLM